MQVSKYIGQYVVQSRSIPTYERTFNHSKLIFSVGVGNSKKAIDYKLVKNCTQSAGIPLYISVDKENGKEF